jgi:2-keto-4-pentenoate hydratase
MPDQPVSHAPIARAEIDHHAAQLRGAYASLVPIAPLRTALPRATIADAYAIQSANTQFWLAEGRIAAGAKIGLTAKSVQQQLGVAQPDFGVLFADMALDDGQIVASGRLIQPKVEAEIAFVMARAPDPARLHASALISAIAYALPAIEIVDSRITNWNIGIIDTIADNASSGLYVLGSRPVAVADIDLRLCGMVLEKNGEPLSFGAGAACLGNPLLALAWLARTMAEVGRPLAAGDVVLSGALGPMVAINPGDTVEARVEGLGSVRVGFEAQPSSGTETLA